MRVKLTAIFLFLCLIIFPFGCAPKNASNQPKFSYTVVIDAGHGGIDGGVTGVNTGVKESDLNLSIANILKDKFISAGFKVVMTRTTSAGLYGTMSKGFKLRDMKKRKEIINSAKPDLMISVHLNKFSDSSRRGAQVFYKIDNENSKRLADILQEEFNGTGRKYSALKGDYYVLNESNCPAVICECGFLSNPQDEILLLTESYREKVAETIVRGAVKYLGNF